MRTRTAWITLTLVLSFPLAASAQWERIEVRGEGLAGAQLPDFQRDSLGYDAGAAAAFRPAFRFLDFLALQLALGGQWFPSDNGTGQLFVVGGGLRLEPRLGTLGRIFVDVNANYGMTGQLSRFSLDVGAGFEFDVHSLVSVGPAVRYSHLFATSDDFPSDAISIWGGASLVVRLGDEPPALSPTADTDGDGWLDPDDLCPRIPAGPHPDPERPGCPLGDRDRDGIHDRDDLCPDTPMGDNPDPRRLGCPAGDADGDGVLDHEDHCPTVHHGDHPDPARPGCPAADTDSDTIVDPDDRCPTVHRGPFPDPERPGCPLPDRDNDMVPDRDDACPDTPGAPNEDRRLNGCPTLVHIQGGQIHINRPVFFATDRDEILDRSRPVLMALRDALRASPFIRRVSVEGHTDDVASDEYNMELSNRRAASVVRWLVENGIVAERLEARGFGETRPIAEGTSARARATNRRVEFHITDPPQPRTAPEIVARPPVPQAQAPSPAPRPTATPPAAPAPRPGIRAQGSVAVEAEVSTPPESSSSDQMSGGPE